MFTYIHVYPYFNFFSMYYLPLIFIYKYFIDSLDTHTKKRLDVAFKGPWTVWCFALSIFSGFGAFYTGQYLLWNYNDGSRVLQTPGAFWYRAFIISKLPELLDTFFIITRSKPLVPLQWYHHWVTLLICYYVSSTECDQYTPFFFMNYLVHFFMYAYFALYTFFGSKLKAYGTFVNILQTGQMFIAIGIASYFYYYTLEYDRCNYVPSGEEMSRLFQLGIFMYVSYFCLFVHLFFERLVRIGTAKTLKAH